MQIEEYENCITQLQGELTRQTSESKMYKVRLNALQKEYEKLFVDHDFFEQVLTKWLDGKSSVKVGSVRIS